MKINEGYYALFSAITQGAAILAETVMKENQKNHDVPAYEKSKNMRDIYQTINFKCKDKKNLSIKDFRDIYIAANLSVTNLESEIKKKQEVLKNYKEKLLPDLKIVIESSDDTFEKNVEEKFSIN